MDISALHIFVDVVRRGSFAAVARDRSVDPSSISRPIVALEAELGIRLSQRTTRQLSLTEAGLVYFERVEPLVEEMAQARLAAVDLGARPTGVLRLTAAVSFGQKCIVPLLPAFSASYPELTMELMLTDAVVDIVTERIDLAIRLGPIPDSTFIARELLRTTYSVCASPDYLRRCGPIDTPDDIRGLNCLRFQWLAFGPSGYFETRWAK